MTQTDLRAMLLSLLLTCGAAVAQPDAGKAARYYEDALKRSEQHDHAGAIVQLKNALQIDKTLLPVQVLLGKSLLAESDPVGASIAFKEAIRLGVSRTEVVVPLARALTEQGKQLDVLEQQLFETAALPPPTRQDLLLVKAQASIDLGQLPRAQRFIDEARAIGQDRAEVWLAEVPIRMRARQFADAMNAIEHALKVAPRSAEALYQRGSVLHVQGKLNAALADYGRALAIDPKHGESLLARAGLHADLGRTSEAMHDIAALAQSMPRDPRAAYMRALMAERAGDHAASRAALGEITALMDPVPIEFIRYRPQFLTLNGLAHFSLGDFGKAKPYLEAAQRVQGPSPIAKLLARVYLNEHAPDKAIEALEAYLRSAGNDAGALTLLASIYIAEGRPARATNLMREALKTKDSPSFQTVLGLSLLQGPQAPEGTASLERAFSKDPRQIYAGAALVTIYLRERQAQKAVTVANALVKQAPGNASLFTLQGNALTQSGDLAGARKSYERALQLNAKLTEAALGLARIDIATRAFESAGKRLAAMLAVDQKLMEALLEMANLSQAQGKSDDAMRWLEKAEALAAQGDMRPELATVHFRMAQGRYADAQAAATRALSKAPEDAALLTLLGRVQLLRDDARGARSSLSAAARRAGGEVELLLDIGELQFRAMDLPGATYSVEKALVEQPGSARGQALLTGIDIQQGDFSRAEKRAAQLVQSHPKLALGHHLQADIALAKRQPGVALEALKRAHQLQPSTVSLLRLFSVQQSVEGLRAAILSAEAWLKREPRDAVVIKAIGDAHGRSRAFAEARKAYERALQLNPKDGDALNSLANVLLQLGDKQAIQLAQQAVKLDANNALYIDTLGWAMHLHGQTEQALPLLRNARLRLPTNTEIRLHLGTVLAKLGRAAEARTELTAAVDTPGAPAIAEQARQLLLTLK